MDELNSLRKVLLVGLWPAGEFNFVALWQNRFVFFLILCYNSMVKKIFSANSENMRHNMGKKMRLDTYLTP